MELPVMIDSSESFVHMRRCSTQPQDPVSLCSRLATPHEDDTFTTKADEVTCPFCVAIFGEEWVRKLRGEPLLALARAYVDGVMGRHTRRGGALYEALVHQIEELEE